jgi:hypothetical protein
VVLEKDEEDQFGRSVKNEVLQRVEEERNMIQSIRRITGWVTPCVGTAFSNTLLKAR